MLPISLSDLVLSAEVVLPWPSTASSQVDPTTPEVKAEIERVRQQIEKVRADQLARGVVPRQMTPPREVVKEVIKEVSLPTPISSTIWWGHFHSCARVCVCVCVCARARVAELPGMAV